MRTYRLNVAYPLDSHYGTIERKIERTIRAESVGSGAGFGERDLDFEFPTKEERDAARSKINRLKIKELKTRP
jgi:hypothetical protein